MNLTPAPVTHHRITVDGIDTFYREAGPPDAPMLLLPHGYPASSFVYRNLMAALGGRWRLIAPDLPGFGYSATPSPEDFGYTFAAYAQFLRSFVDATQLERYVIWLHDYGSQFGIQLAMAKPERVAGLVIQNGDIYEDAFGPKYDFLRESWDNPGPAARRKIAQHVTLKGFEGEFRGELPEDVADRISPDLWTLHWSLMSTPDRIANLIHLLEDQPNTLKWFSDEQAYLREQQPPTLIVWGRTTAICPRSLPAPTSATCPTLRCTCSAAGIGCWKPTSTRSCPWSTTSWQASIRRTSRWSRLGESNPRPIHYE